MASERSASALAWIPRTWFDPVVGLWTVLLAVAAIHLALRGVAVVLVPLGTAPWAALAITALAATAVYGGLGYGVAAVYRRSRGFEARPIRGVPDRTARWWLAGLVGLAPLLMALGGIPSRDDLVATPLLSVDTIAYPEGLRAFSLGLVGVNDLVNQAPIVLVGALLGGLLMGPALAALVHGVLQDTLSRVAPANVAVPATALAATALVGETDPVAVDTVVVFAFVLAVGVAYRRTDDLVVALAAYGAFDALAMVFAWANILASLHAAGHLVG